MTWQDTESAKAETDLSVSTFSLGALPISRLLGGRKQPLLPVQALQFYIPYIRMQYYAGTASLGSPAAAATYYGGSSVLKCAMHSADWSPCSIYGKGLQNLSLLVTSVAAG